MKSILLCLHGWGADHHSFDALRAELKNSGIDVFTPMFPGFGDQPEPDHSWTNDDFVHYIEQYIHKNIGTHPFAILGHSHGGRIAIKIAANEKREMRNEKLTHLFLCAAAGIKHPRHIKRAIGLTLAKTGKILLSIPGFKILQPLGKRLLYQLVRVHDYERASPIMRQTMINVCKEDLRPLLKQITIPTDIFWGENDGMTPLADGIFMHEKIKGSFLHTYPHTRHRVHRDHAKEIAQIISERLI